jgi:uncharacterized protein YndB with AHSA1/START domain
MTVAKPSYDTTLRLARSFDAPREKVFQAWTDPEKLKQWWGPKGFNALSAEVDLRTGGNWSLEIRDPEGETFRQSGTYQEVKPLERLVFSLACGKLGKLVEDSKVTVEFNERGSATEVAVTHERIDDATAREVVTMGWTGSLDRLTQCCPGA